MLYLLLVMAGTLLGALGGLLGIGGGIIAIPLLSLWFGFSQHLAQGTSLLLIVPNVLIACLKYHRHHAMDIKCIAKICFVAGACAYVAARMAVNLPNHLLQILFSIFLCLIGGFYLIQRREPAQTGSTVPALSEKYMPLFGVLSGIMSGVFSVGGGLVVTPGLVTLFGFSQTCAQGFALAMVLPGSLAALYLATQAHHVSWEIGIPLAIGGLSSVSYGASLAHKLPEHILRFIFSLAMFASAGLTLMFG